MWRVTYSALSQRVARGGHDGLAPTGRRNPMAAVEVLVPEAPNGLHWVVDRSISIRLSPPTPRGSPHEHLSLHCNS
jgi:hypothetical protein